MFLLAKIWISLQQLVHRFTGFSQSRQIPSQIREPKLRQPMLPHARSAPVSTRTVLPFVYPFRYASLAVFPVYPNADVLLGGK